MVAVAPRPIAVPAAGSWRTTAHAPPEPWPTSHATRANPAACRRPIASPSFFPRTFGVSGAAALGAGVAVPVGWAPRGNDEKKRNRAKRIARTARIATLLSKRGSVQPRTPGARVDPRDEVGSLPRSAASENARANAPALAYRRSGSVARARPTIASSRSSMPTPAGRSDGGGPTRRPRPSPSPRAPPHAGPPGGGSVPTDPQPWNAGVRGPR